MIVQLTPKFTQVRVSIPPSIDCFINNTSADHSVLFFKGQGGTKKLFVRNEVNVIIEPSDIVLTSFTTAAKPLVGTYASLIRNTLQGIQNHFTQFVELRGLGYSVTLSGDVLEFKLGYSHTQTFALPSSVTGEVVGNRSRVIKLQSAD